MILLIANSRDFATDHVVAELRRRGKPYLRIDTDLLREDEVTLDPVDRRLSIVRNRQRHELRDRDVEAVLYRAPTHLAESSADRHPPEQALARHQWAAFARSLVVLEHPLWVNHPQRTYLAENKPFQLATAASLGFRVPSTRVTNALPAAPNAPWSDRAECALKALDTFLVRDGDSDLFFYTQRIVRTDSSLSLRAMPVILQSYLSPKVDVRVTVVGADCFAASVLVDGAGVEGDWRTRKGDVQYVSIPLPRPVEELCVSLVRRLGLVFGAIDLARVGDEYYFLEINPTGEWAWLIESAGLPIDRSIADALCRGR